MKEHELKCWPEFFVPISHRLKTFEIRKNDRDFQVGDILILEEWDPEDEDYTGRTITAFVPYIMRPGSGPTSGIKDGFVIMALEIKSMDL
jgi:hypothetical protein